MTWRKKHCSACHCGWRILGNAFIAVNCIFSRALDRRLFAFFRLLPLGMDKYCNTLKSDGWFVENTTNVFWYHWKNWHLRKRPSSFAFLADITDYPNSLLANQTASLGAKEKIGKAVPWYDIQVSRSSRSIVLPQLVSLVSSFQTEFKEWFHDISRLSIGSDCGRLRAIASDELPELQDNTTV